MVAVTSDRGTGPTRAVIYCAIRKTIAWGALLACFDTMLQVTRVWTDMEFVVGLSEN